MLPLAAVGLLGVAALTFVAYILWPRWPAAAVPPDAPAIPVTIAGVAFNVPPAAIRVAMQRRPGAHERVDLVFLWPSLEAPDPAAKPAAGPPGAPPALSPTMERLFVTITGAGAALSPADRVKVIYPRYTASDPVPGPDGLAVLAFRNGTPYQGEDLIYETAGGFLVRCTRNGAGPPPGTCLYDRRIEGADLLMRFPRDWLADWRAVAAGIERLIVKLRPPRS